MLNVAAVNVVCPLSAVCVLWLVLIVYLPEWSSLRTELHTNLVMLAKYTDICK